MTDNASILAASTTVPPSPRCAKKFANFQQHFAFHLSLSPTPAAAASSFQRNNEKPCKQNLSSCLHWRKAASEAVAAASSSFLLFSALAHFHHAAAAAKAERVVR
jgi:hypothetical protein